MTAAEAAVYVAERCARCSKKLTRAELAASESECRNRHACIVRRLAPLARVKGTTLPGYSSFADRQKFAYELHMAERRKAEAPPVVIDWTEVAAWAA